MGFNSRSFQSGVGSQQASVLGLLDLVPVVDVVGFDPGKIQRTRAGNQDVFNPLATEQQVTSEYLDRPSVLSIRRGLTVLAATDKFILGSFNEADQERMSFVFTFGDPVIFGGMGRRPRMFTYSGFLKDSLLGGKGISTWRKMYDRYLRGSKCRESGAVADLKFRDQWRVGYIVASNMSYEETKPRVAPFSFSMFIIQAE